MAGPVSEAIPVPRARCDDMEMAIDPARFPNVASIESQKFRLGLKGYNVNDVDQFLSALAVEVATMQSALESAESEVARLKSQQSES